MAAANANNECPVCTETLNKSNHKAVECAFCTFKACRECCSRYILESIDDPACMSCRKHWSRDFLLSAFPKTFLYNALKTHREGILFEREKGMLPATQAYVERLIEIKDATENLRLLNERRFQLKNEMNLVNQQINDLTMMRYGLQNGINALGAANTIRQEKRQFVRQCPVDGCLGFLSTQWKCGLCNVWVCPDCHEVKGAAKDAEHTCRPEDVETAKLIAKESKSCPSCGVRTCKIDGCNQMWCTSCHQAWNWATGRIETGRIHNPHYIAYINGRGAAAGGMQRDHADIPCGGLPAARALQRHLVQLGFSLGYAAEILGNLRHVLHIWEVEAPRYRVDDLVSNVDLRAKYMMKEIDEDKFKVMLQKRERMNQRNREFYQVLQTFRDVCVDIFNSILNTRNTEVVDRCCEDYQNILEHTTRSMCDVARKYNCVTPKFILV